MYTTDELITVCISRQINDGETVAQGIATPLVAAGYLLARLTHAPNLTFLSAIGQAYCRDWAPLAVANIESLWIGKGLHTFDFVTAACDLLPRFGPKEFFRPGQVDAHGNFNNVFVGDDYRRPRLRLPGAGGIPDVSITGDRLYLYVPRHGRHTFVEKIDFRSGIGRREEAGRERGPRYLVSDLGQFDFNGPDRCLRPLTLHRGVAWSTLQSRTGFGIEVADPSAIPSTEPPTDEELHLLRHVIDPLGVRRLETLRGAERGRALRRILAAEKAAGFPIEPDERGAHDPTVKHKEA